MGGQMKAMMIVALLLVVVVATTSIFTAEARLDLSSIGMDEIENFQVLEENTYEKKRGCCNFCPCTKSIPPQCRCTDVKASCHAECKACRCTKSIPPQCTCMDITNFCYKECPSFTP